jgi:hypothetical protein
MYTKKKYKRDKCKHWHIARREEKKMFSGGGGVTISRLVPVRYLLLPLHTRPWLSFLVDVSSRRNI